MYALASECFALSPQCLKSSIIVAVDFVPVKPEYSGDCISSRYYHEMIRWRDDSTVTQTHKYDNFCLKTIVPIFDPRADCCRSFSCRTDHAFPKQWH